ncbi:phosphoglycerate kinase [candidate division WOR-3 bacterium]|uniref:Phosphoglycerate kinase n=1 Tax=candidate division WOR-3 bacterium TaxID=2052148 RepID=A0A9D5QCW4_UNCW3|nr:phosphoglycerate kinase [candidate division WOR-3 bacterium]MBD3364421.1 phosphoglycerate kinase [candidate division WOR-3 bacterium]
MTLRKVEDLPIQKGDRVLVRVDYNIPVNEEGLITDDSRITGTLETLNHLLDKGAVPIILAHWDRPQGERKEEMSLARVIRELEMLLDKPVNFLAEVLGESTEAAIEAGHPGEIFLLENLRFHPGERGNDPEFTKHLASYGSYYVNDAFPVSHRAQSSVSLLPNLFDAPAAGFSLAREFSYFEKVLLAPEHPYVIIIGGKKIHDKVAALRRLLRNGVDQILMGGSSAMTVQAARGKPVGKSLIDENLVEEIDDIADSEKIKLPVDYVTAPSPEVDGNAAVVAADKIPDNYKALDIGPETAKRFEKSILDSRTVVWLGPLGVYEKEAFAQGSLNIARSMAKVTKTGTLTVTGGGETLAMIGKFGLKDKLSHVSIGGGACLAFLEGKDLPGIMPLIKRS